MKVKEALKDLNLKINSILVEAYTEISEEIKNIKKIIDDEKSEEKIKLIEQICKGEELNEKEIKNKYLTEKDKKKIKIIPETVEVINDELLDTVEIEEKTYWVLHLIMINKSNYNIIYSKILMNKVKYK